MPQYRIHFETRVMAPVDRVFSFLSDHQNLVSLFGDRRQWVREGVEEPDGIGSVRRMGDGFLAFEETITRFDRPQAIGYLISRGSPLTNHRGEIRLAPAQDGAETALDYCIGFGGGFPLIGALARMEVETQLPVGPCQPAVAGRAEQLLFLTRRQK